jgi:hypothetical protein
LIVTDARAPRFAVLVCAVTLTANAFGSTEGFAWGVGREVALSTWVVGLGLVAAELGATLPVRDPQAATARAVGISKVARIHRRTFARA